MSTAAKIEPDQPSPYFQALLAALMNAGNDEYERALDAVNDYVAALENVGAVMPFAASTKLILRTRERDRLAYLRAMEKADRYDCVNDKSVSDLGSMQRATVGEWLFRDDVLGVLA